MAAAGSIFYLRRAAPPSFLRATWLWTLAGWGLSALLGAVTHGIPMSGGVKTLLWQPLYISLGVAQALLVVAAIGAGWGEAAARRSVPFMLVAAGAFYWATRATGGNFLVFVVFSTGTLLFALAVFGTLGVRGREGAGLVAAALALSLAAGGVQASSLAVRLVWLFDHNGLFHLVQLLGLAVLVPGLRRMLGVTAPNSSPGGSRT